MYSPLEQFEVVPLKVLFGIFDRIGISVTNFTIFSMLLCIGTFVFFFVSVFYLTLIPSSGQYCLEAIYMFVYNILASNLEYEEHHFFPYIFTIFMFILLSNVFGLLPYSYTLTSQILVTSLLSFSSFIALIVIGVQRHGFDVLGLFFPSDAPIAMAFLLVPIEIVSFFSRPFSLAIRLFANLTAGHVLLKVLTGFSAVLISATIGFVPSFELLVQKLAILPFAGIEGRIPRVTVNDITFALFNVQYLSYNISLFNNCAMSYYSHLFHAGDLLINLEDVTEPVDSIWFMPYKWRQLYQMNYMSPIFLPNLSTLDLTFSIELTLRLLRTVAGRKLLSTYHSPSFFYFYDSYLFSYYMTQSNYQLFSFITDDLILVLFNLSFIFNVLNYVASIVISVLAFLLPVCILSFFILLELFVSILQAYVFTILLVIYIRDIVELH